ncbi:MAG: SpoIIE family protein phosphatase, partial [Desulforhopalus sp.]
DLPNGYMMLLYTDGITDAINQQYKMFGIEGIFRTISSIPKPSASRIGGGLIEAVKKHQSHVQQFDDLTVVSVRAVEGVQ